MAKKRAKEKIMELSTAANFFDFSLSWLFVSTK